MSGHAGGFMKWIDPALLAEVVLGGGCAKLIEAQHVVCHLDVEFFGRDRLRGHHRPPPGTVGAVTAQAPFNGRVFE